MARKEYNWLLLFLVIIFLSLGIISFLAYQNYQLRKQVSQVQILPKATPFPSLSTTVLTKDELFSTIKAQLQEIKEKYGGEVLETDNLEIWWVSPDDLNIINDNSSGVVLQVPIFSFVEDVEKNRQKLFKELASLIGSKIDRIMKQNGFRANERNSSTSIEDTRFYDYIQAYENESVKCVFKANPDYGWISSEGEELNLYFFSFGCTEDFDRNYQQQVKYLKDLDIKDGIIRVEKRIGEFVKLNVRGRRSGYYIIARLIDGKWNEIFSGQDYPMCETIEEYKIPKEIIDYCHPSEPQN